MKVKTHSIKEITWILSLSPRECLGFRLLQFISFKNKWRGKELSFEFVRKPTPPFSMLWAFWKHPTQRWADQISHGFKEKTLEFEFKKKKDSSIKTASFPDIHSLSFSFSHPPGTREIWHYMCHIDCSMWGRKEPLSYGPKNKARNLKCFQVIRATDSCLVPNIVLLGITGHTVATGSGAKCCREMG